LTEPQVPYGDPQLPDVPYGGPGPTPGATPPRWLRRLFEEPDPPDSVPSGAVLLAEPPRAVPLPYRLAALGLGGWELFAVVLAVLAPMALWITSPALRTVALLVGTPLLLWTRQRRYARMVGILRWGRVATVTTSTSRPSSSSFTNWPMRQAHGWDVTSVLFTGKGTTTDVAYTVDSRPGQLTVRGLPYADGVILADPRHPGRAMVVSQFPHSVKPRLDGRYVGWLAPGRWAWLVLSLALEVGLVLLTGWSVRDLVG